MTYRLQYSFGQFGLQEEIDKFSATSACKKESNLRRPLG
jgi:hypothetical protein